MSTAFKHLEAWSVYQGNPAIPVKKRPNFIEEPDAAMLNQLKIDRPTEKSDNKI